MKVELTINKKREVEARFRTDAGIYTPVIDARAKITVEGDQLIVDLVVLTVKELAEQQELSIS